MVVHTVAGMSIKGKKRAVYDDGVLLCDAYVLEDGESQIRILDGDAFIFKHQLLFMQILPPEDI